MSRIDLQHIQYSHQDALAEFINETTYDAIEELIVERFPATSRLLDIGCGRGELIRRLANKGYRIIGCDDDPKCVALSSKYGHVEKMSIEDLSLDRLPDQVDIAVCSHVLEHVRDPVDALQRIFSLGVSKAILVVPNPYCTTALMRALLRRPPQCVNEGHRYSWDWDHFLTLLRHGAGLDVLAWRNDAVFLPLPGFVRKYLLKLGILPPLEKKLLPFLLPQFSRSIIALVAPRVVDEPTEG